jgi:hypothetical protein
MKEIGVQLAEVYPPWRGFMMETEVYPESFSGPASAR